MNNTPYRVISATNLDYLKHPHPELAWMDIPEWKLDLALSSGQDYQVEYHHHVNEVYVCSYLFSYSAAMLKKALETHRDKIYRQYTGRPFYRVYLEYTTGILLTGYSSTAKIICKLQPLCRNNPVRLGNYVMEQETVDVLLQLIASTAIWAPVEAVQAQDPASFTYVRRRSGDPKKGVIVNGIKYDDNTRPNTLIKAAVKKYRHFGIAPNEYAVCHIWENSCYNPKYYTDLRNLVLLPRALSSLSDYNSAVSQLLKYHSTRLFGKWCPDGCELPSKPTQYGNIKWLILPDIKK